MNIIFLSFYSGVIERGVEIWVKELALRLSKNHKVIVYQVGKESHAFEKKIQMDVNWDKPTHSSSLSSKLLADYWSLQIFQFTKKVLKQIKNEKVDIIIPTNGGWQSILCKIYTLQHKSNMVIVGHSGLGWDDRINILIRPNTFVTLTQYQKKWAQKIRKESNISVIPDGINLDDFLPNGFRVKLNLPKPIFLTVSSLQESKRVDLVIKAVSKLKQGSLVILGKGTTKETEKVENLGKTLLGDNFLLTSITHSEIDKWYRSADVFTFSSYSNEAFGMVIVEAMACNKPVVVNDDPIRREIVGEAGLFCNPLDIDNYSKTLNKATEIQWRNKPLNQAKKYDWEKIVVQYNNLFKSL